MIKKFKITKKEKLEGSMFLIEGEISKEAILAEKDQAIKKYQEILKVDGFRKGHIPEKIIREKVGDLTLWEEQGSFALELFYSEIVKEVEISPIGQPNVAITKIAPGTDMSFKIETATAPVFELPDYKKIAAGFKKNEKEVESVTDKEVDETIEVVRKSMAHQKFHEEHGDTVEHNHDIKDEDLPIVSDEWVKTLGQFESVTDFKNKIKENILADKKVKAREKARLSIMEAIMSETKIDLPEILIESEQMKLLSQVQDYCQSIGLTFDEYLKRIKKTEDELLKENRDEAIKRAKIQLILSKIANLENIEADEKEIDHQVKQLGEFYKEADPTRLRIYVETMMRNERVWKYLENLS